MNTQSEGDRGQEEGTNNEDLLSLSQQEVMTSMGARIAETVIFSSSAPGESLSDDFTLLEHGFYELDGHTIETFDADREAAGTTMGGRVQKTENEDGSYDVHVQVEVTQKTPLKLGQKTKKNPQVVKRGSGWMTVSTVEYGADGEVASFKTGEVPTEEQLGFKIAGADSEQGHDVDKQDKSLRLTAAIIARIGYPSRRTAEQRKHAQEADSIIYPDVQETGSYLSGRTARMTDNRQKAA